MAANVVVQLGKSHPTEIRIGQISPGNTGEKYSGEWYIVFLSYSCIFSRFFCSHKTKKMEGGATGNFTPFPNDDIVFKYITNYNITNILHGSNGYTIFIENTNPSFGSQFHDAVLPGRKPTKSFVDLETQKPVKNILIKMCALNTDPSDQVGINQGNLSVCREKRNNTWKWRRQKLQQL